jgi:iron complex outermembrane receptor protein
MDTTFSDSADFEGYTSFDANFAYAFDSGLVSLGVENLSNKQFVTYFSQTNPNDGRFFAGRGRTISVTWSQRF